jgi:L-threonylcarbamoyladenylate synthase
MDTEQQIETAIEILKKGGVIAFPTDTVYGFGANAALESAVEKIYVVKHRPHHLPLPLLISDITQLAPVACRVTPLAWYLAKRFWPGGLTLVLHKSSEVLDVITAGSDTVAVRVPAHPVPVAIIEGLGTPIIGTSANLSGSPGLATAQEVSDQIGDGVDFIIEGDKCHSGVESTVVDVTTEHPKILREGAIPVREIERACNLREVGGR